MTVTRVGDPLGSRPFTRIIELMKPPQGHVLINRQSFEAAVRSRLGIPDPEPEESVIVAPPRPRIAIAQAEARGPN